MNAAEYQTMCDLAYTKAIELATMADHAGHKEKGDEWFEMAKIIIDDCLCQSGKVPVFVIDGTYLKK